MSPGRARGKLSILIFHRVLPVHDPLMPDEIDAARFDQILTWVGNMFNVLPLSEAVERTFSDSLPPRALSITFDDGYADNAAVALPILQKHCMVATFFVATGFLDGKRMWNDTIIESVRRSQDDVLALDVQALGDVQVASTTEKREAISKLIGYAKYLPPEQRHRFVGEVADTSKASLPLDLMMSSAQVRELQVGGMEIGAHTVTHPILACLSPDQARQEMADSRDRLVEITGDPIRLFAYPNGKRGDDFKDEHARTAADLGFLAAVTTEPGVSSSRADRYQLPRFTPWDRSSGRFYARMMMNMRQVA